MTHDSNEWLSADSKHELEIRYLVENTDLSPLQAKELVKKYGPDRSKLLEVARTMKSES